MEKRALTDANTDLGEDPFAKKQCLEGAGAGAGDVKKAANVPVQHGPGSLFTQYRKPTPPAPPSWVGKSKPCC